MTDSTYLDFFHKQQGNRDGNEMRIGLKFRNDNYKENVCCTCTITWL